MAGSPDTEPSQHFERLPTFRSALASKNFTTNNSESDTPDGRRFLVVTSNQSPGTTPLTLVTNWNAELKTK
jgi:hypothetical protein